jgi:cation diffusion facilitator family transporter
VSGPPAPPDSRAGAVSRVLRHMLAVSLVLVVAKTAVGVASGSLAVVGGAFDSGLDVLTTLVAMAMVRLAAAEPDDQHPYGHEKFEALGALVMVAFLSISVYELVRAAVGRLMAGGGAGEVDTRMGLAVMAASFAVGLLASEYERRRGVALGSELLRADAAHLRADALVSAAVVAGLLLTAAGWRSGDAWAALLVAGLIVRTGVHIVRDAVPVLVDERAVEAVEIRGMAEAMDGVRSAYDVRSRGRPGARFAELTIAVPPGLDIAAAHRIADRVEEELRGRLGARRVVVHVEPEEGRG